MVPVTGARDSGRVTIRLPLHVSAAQRVRVAAAARCTGERRPLAADA